MPGNGTQPALPRIPPQAGQVSVGSSAPQLLPGAIRILTEFGGVQYFSRKMGLLDQENDFPVHCALCLCGYVLTYFRSGRTLSVCSGQSDV